MVALHPWIDSLRGSGGGLVSVENEWKYFHPVNWRWVKVLWGMDLLVMTCTVKAIQPSVIQPRLTKCLTGECFRWMLLSDIVLREFSQNIWNIWGKKITKILKEHLDIYARLENVLMSLLYIIKSNQVPFKERQHKHTFQANKMFQLIKRYTCSTKLRQKVFGHFLVVKW